MEFLKKYWDKASREILWRSTKDSLWWIFWHSVRRFFSGVSLKILLKFFQVFHRNIHQEFAGDSHKISEIFIGISAKKKPELKCIQTPNTRCFMKIFQLNIFSAWRVCNPWINKLCETWRSIYCIALCCVQHFCFLRRRMAVYDFSPRWNPAMTHASMHVIVLLCPPILINHQ